MTMHTMTLRRAAFGGTCLVALGAAVALRAQEAQAPESAADAPPAAIEATDATAEAQAPAAAQPREAELSQADDPYFKQAHQALQQILQLQQNTNHAKNVILIVGDGMGFSTVTATRIFEGQQRGADGESNVLA